MPFGAGEVGGGEGGGGACRGCTDDVWMRTAFDTEISALLDKSCSKSSQTETNLENSLAFQIVPVVDRSNGALSKHRVNTAFSDALKSETTLSAEAEKLKVRLSSLLMSHGVCKIVEEIVVCFYEE